MARYWSGQRRSSKPSQWVAVSIAVEAVGLEPPTMLLLTEAPYAAELLVVVAERVVCPLRYYGIEVSRDVVFPPESVLSPSEVLDDILVWLRLDIVFTVRVSKGSFGLRRQGLLRRRSEGLFGRSREASLFLGFSGRFAGDL